MTRAVLVTLVLAAACLVLLGGVSPAAAAPCEDPRGPGCQDLHSLQAFNTDALVAAGRMKTTIDARARRATTVARRTALAAEVRRAITLTRTLRTAVIRERRRWVGRDDVDRSERLVGRDLLSATIAMLGTARIDHYRGILADIRNGLPIRTSAAGRRRAAAAERRSGVQVRRARSATRRAGRTTLLLDSDFGLGQAWLQMLAREAVIDLTLRRLLRPTVGGDRVSRSQYAAVTEVFARARLNELAAFDRALDAATGLERLEGCRPAFSEYVSAATARDRVIGRYADAVAGAERRRTRNLWALYRALDRAADDRLGTAQRCLRSAGTAQPAPQATTGTILPIGAISRSRVVATSAASVQIVVRFPKDTTLEVNVFRPDGSLVPGFNGPSPFPATLRTNASGDATGSYGIVRGTSPTGTWKVVVNVRGRPDLAATRTFAVVD